MKPEVERRRFARIDSLLPCVYYPAPMPRQARVINISLGGAALIMPVPVPRWQPLAVCFPASPGMPMLEAPAQVVHLTRRSDGRWLVGVVWADWANWVPEVLAPWLERHHRLSS